MRMLLVTPFVPHRGIGHGTATVAAYFFDYFAARHTVAVTAFAFDEREEALAAELTPRCAGITTVRFAAGTVRRWSGRVGAALGGTPYMIRLFDLPAMRAAVRRQVERRSFDLVQFDTTFMGSYVDQIATGPHRPLTSLVEIDVSVRPLARRMALERRALRRAWYRRELGRMERYEPALCRRFDRVLAVSDEDRAELQRLDSGLDVGLFRYGADLPPAVAERPGRGENLLFIGAFLHRPNVEAAEWLCRAVLPLIRTARPDVSCSCVGDRPPARLQRLAAECNVTMPGRVADLRTPIAAADVGVVPLRSGGGVKLKTLELMAAGRAIVTTRVGIEGVNARDGEHVLIADTAGAFARAVLRLLEDGELRARLGRNARALIAREHQWPENLRRLERDYIALIGAAEPSYAAV